MENNTKRVIWQSNSTGGKNPYVTKSCSFSNMSNSEIKKKIQSTDKSAKNFKFSK